MVASTRYGRFKVGTRFLRIPKDLAVVIVDFLEAALAAHWSAEARQSWTLALNVIVDQICNVLEEP